MEVGQRVGGDDKELARLRDDNVRLFALRSEHKISWLANTQLEHESKTYSQYRIHLGDPILFLLE